jgi:hypothetical protein
MNGSLWSWRGGSGRGKLLIIVIVIALVFGGAYSLGYRLSFLPGQSVAFNGNTSIQTVSYTGFCSVASGSYNYPGYNFCNGANLSPSTSTTSVGSSQNAFSLPVANLAGKGGSCASGQVWSQCGAAAAVLSSNSQSVTVGGNSQYPACQAPPGQQQPVTPCIDSNGNLAYGCPIGPGLPPCPASSIPPLSSTVSGSGYTLNGQILGGAFKLVGGDTTFCSISGISCGQQNTWSYNLASLTLTAYRFGFIVQISVSGDHVVAKTTCQVAVSFYTDQCTTQMVNSLNQVLNVINQNDLAKGQVVLNISVPTSYVASNLTRYGIIDGFLGPNGQCTIPSASSGPSCGNSGTGGCIVSLPYGGQAAITPCQGGANIPSNVGGGYGISAFPVAGTQFQISQTQMQQLNPNVQYTFTITGLGPQYKALCGTANCSASSTQDCLTAGGGTTAVGGNINANACFIQADYGITIQIPIVFDVLGYAPCTKCITSGSTTTQNVTTSGGGITVHVQDGVLGLPVNSAQVGYASTSGGGGCSSSQQSTGTDANGNVAFYGLPAGSYVICASAGSGTVTLLFFTVGIVYQQQQANAGVSSGANTPVLLVLQPSLGSAFTLIGAIAFFVILILIALVVIVLVLGAGKASTALNLIGGGKKIAAGRK